MSNLNWREIGAWNVGRPDGTSEKYILSRSDATGDFQLKNEYGNIIIDMELMSGIEFIKRVLDKMQDELDMDLDDISDSDDWLDNLDDDSDEDSSVMDCDYTD